MDYFYLVLLSCAIAGQSVIGGFYKQKSASPFVYQMAISVAAFFFFFIGAKCQIKIDRELLLYGSIYGISYSIYFIGQILAIKEGSISLTALVLSYSLIIPTLFGIIAYKEYPSVLFYIGFICFAASLFFIGIPREKNTLKITKKWVAFVLLSFFANGVCAIVLSRYQLISSGENRFEFMGFAMIVAIIVSAVALLMSKENKKENFSRTVLYGGACGIVNAASNFLLMILAIGSIPMSIVYPTISAVSLLLSTVLSRIIFKEKLDKLGMCGMAIGLIAVILMNI